MFSEEKNETKSTFGIQAAFSSCGPSPKLFFSLKIFSHSFGTDWKLEIRINCPFLMETIANVLKRRFIKECRLILTAIHRFKMNIKSSFSINCLHQFQF
jgi:hypothetical protein